MAKVKVNPNKRIKLVEVELSWQEEPGPVPSGYDEMRVLVRQNSVPVAYVNLTPSSLPFAALLKLALSNKSTSPDPTNPKPESSSVSGQALISVAVCTRNRTEQLRDTLQSLIAQTYPHFEILVIDNAPSDTSSHQLVAEFMAASFSFSSLDTSPSEEFSSQIRYIVEPRPGLDWARNRAIKEARGEIIAYTDDDARPDPNWLEEVARAFEDKTVAAMTGLVIPAELETSAQVIFEDLYGGFGKGFERKLYHKSRPLRRAFPYAAGIFGAGCNMAFRREVFEQIGGFDTALDVGTATGGGGDMDIFIRVLREDFTLLYEPKAVVRHLHRRDLPALQRQMAGYACAFYAYLFKWAITDCYRAADILGYAARAWFNWIFLKAVFALLGKNGVPPRIALTQFLNAPRGPFAYAYAKFKARKLSKLS